MKVLIEINCDNSAFGDYPSLEVSDILNTLSQKVKYDLLPDKDIPVMDSNGNKVGFLRVEN